MESEKYQLIKSLFVCGVFFDKHFLSIKRFHQKIFNTVPTQKFNPPLKNFKIEIIISEKTSRKYKMSTNLNANN